MLGLNEIGLLRNGHELFLATSLDFCCIEVMVGYMCDECLKKNFMRSELKLQLNMGAVASWYGNV